MPVHYHLGRFPPEGMDLERLVPLIGRAHAALAAYNALLVAIPNPSVLLSPLVTQEAVLSSKIEGTHATVGEVLEFEADLETSTFERAKRNDIEEIRNYRMALSTMAKSLTERPLSQQLLREAHAMLMQGVRGQGKSPGAYRSRQNWIGPEGGRLEDASFVPIAPEHLAAGMDAWTSYLLDERQLDPIVQLAVAHVEFEALHPFEDGNGRLGRMIIPLYLYARGLLRSPDFYMSGYFDRNHDAYVARLRAVSSNDAWNDWCAYFLDGVIRQATANERKARAILELYERCKNDVVDLTHSQYAVRTVDFLFQYPIFASPHLAEASGIPTRATAMRILRLLREAGLVRTIRPGRGRRSGIFAFPELLNLAEGEDAF
ncbi:MAG: Fic/DOC family N-terminal domain-containing protein [Trueperaceae bacterium]|nr:Fic/DOC family N-terminal domain-containing protein [Trueperaceae bacterium]